MDGRGLLILCFGRKMTKKSLLSDLFYNIWQLHRFTRHISQICSVSRPNPDCIHSLSRILSFYCEIPSGDNLHPAEWCRACPQMTRRDTSLANPALGGVTFDTMLSNIRQSGVAHVRKRPVATPALQIQFKVVSNSTPCYPTSGRVVSRTSANDPSRHQPCKSSSRWCQIRHHVCRKPVT